MTLYGRLRSYLVVPEGDPDLIRAQFAAISKQLPVLYGILLVNTLALAATHLMTAPFFMTVVLPAVLTLVCLVRVVVWRMRSRVVVSDRSMIKRLRGTTYLTGVLGVTFTLWALCLYPYGDVFAQCHVAFFMSITVISCIFCLTHVRGAALLLTATHVFPFTVFFLLTGELVMIAIALNLVLVTTGMIFILLRNYNDFAALIGSQRELVLRQAETQRLSDENVRLANLDLLTELPNRRRFLSELDRVLAGAEQKGSRFAVALIDLDGFKAVNDTYGHATGDRLLAEVGERLSQWVGPSVIIARLGGDEFGVILCANPSDADILAIGEGICACLERPYLMASIVAEISGSMGIVVYPEGGDSAAQLFERADYALYFAKETRRGTAVMFSSEHETSIRVAARLDQALRHADLENELWLAYQPIVDGESLAVLGFEALARWSSPVLGHVGPDQFIPAAERIRLIGKLTEVLFAKALSAASQWPAPLRIAFNLSAQDIISVETIAVVREIVSASGIDPGRIDIEITETAVMRDFEQASQALASLRQMGMRISLDDFGTGFSSLSHVHRLKPDKIKIDKSFLADICQARASRDIVRTIVDLCHSLGLDCVVEGVETQDQMRAVMKLGCKVMQGYLFSKPIPEAEIAQYLEWRLAPAAGTVLATGPFETDRECTAEVDLEMRVGTGSV